MTRRLLPWLTLVGLLLALKGMASDPPKPAVKDPLPFVHDHHAKAFKKADITCVTCHPVGLRVVEGDNSAAPDTPTEPPLTLCHTCHLEGIRGPAARHAPKTCTTCHPNESELIPPSHGHAWATLHGAAARVDSTGCESCHAPRQCIDCHDQRGPLSANPHGPGFARTHGVEARLDPYSCTTCHSVDTCSTCHSEGVQPW